MSDIKLAAVKELLHEKNYDAARAVLETIRFNPTAVKILARLDEVAPVSQPAVDSPRRRIPTWVKVLAATVGVAVLGFLVLVLLTPSPVNTMIDQQLPGAREDMMRYCKTITANEAACNEWIDYALGRDLEKIIAVQACADVYGTSRGFVTCISDRGVYVP